MTLTEFLLARIAEDEAQARAAVDIDGDPDSGVWHVVGRRDGYEDCRIEGADMIIYDEGGHTHDQSLHIARHDPARVLAECEAKRRIVEAAVEAQRGTDGWTRERLKTDTRSPLPEWARRDAYAEALRALALPYADHPDYRQGWKP
jgi:hypothetical protein